MLHPSAFIGTYVKRKGETQIYGWIFGYNGKHFAISNNRDYGVWLTADKLELTGTRKDWSNLRL